MSNFDFTKTLLNGSKQYIDNKTTDGSNHSHSWNNLEDRPFYEVPPTEVEVVTETTANFEYNNSNRYYGEAPVSGDVSFNLDKTYTVVWDGVRYNNVPCIDSLGGPQIGSGNTDIANAQNEYPFCFGIGYNDEPILTVVTDSTDEVHTFKILEIIDGYVKTIDSKYLPTSGGGMFLIKGIPGEGTIPMTSYKRMVIDKTYEEIKAAYESGQLIALSFDQGEWYSDEIFYLTQHTDSGFFNFSRVDKNGEELIYYQFTIQDNGDYGYVSPV